jgi:hypothetical protein
MGVNYNPRIVTDGLVLALDPGNKKSYSQNEFQYSTDIFAWSGSTGHNASIISRDSISSPVGNTPLRMQVTGNDPHLGTYNSATWNIAPALNAQTWIVSVYVKANVATTGELLIFGANSAGVSFVGGGWLTLSAVTVNITTEWTRVSHRVTMNNPNISFIHMRLDGPNSGGTGQTVWWDGLQVERVPTGTTTPTPFTSLYQGGNILKDSSGNGNTGTLVNYPTYNGNNFGSFDFNGQNDGIGLNKSLLGTLNEFSTIVWFKPKGIKSGAQMLIHEGASGDGFGGNNEFHIHYQNDGTINAWMTGGININSPTGRVPTNNFSQVVYTVSGLSGSATANLYLNGSIVGSGSGIISRTGYTNLLIGRPPIITFPTIPRSYEGEISQVLIYNRALTAQEIRQNFDSIRRRFSI